MRTEKRDYFFQGTIGHINQDLAPRPHSQRSTRHALIRLPSHQRNRRSAIGTLRAAHALKIPVPDALSVVGFDDLEAVELVSPGLTTVRQPLSTMGSTAAAMLLQLISNENPPGRHIQLTTELIARHSVAAPQAASR
jgi:hypothetical protein